MLKNRSLPMTSSKPTPKTGGSLTSFGFVKKKRPVSEATNSVSSSDDAAVRSVQSNLTFQVEESSLSDMDHSPVDCKPATV